jgi:hypothetical protein
MNFRIAIPSCGRVDYLLNKTIKYLEQCNIDFNYVDIFLSKANEYEEYKKKLNNYPVNLIISNNNSINEQRNFIVKYYKDGQRLLGLDDDIVSLETKVNDKKTTIFTDLISLENQAYELCVKNKLNLWGVSASLNPYFMKQTISFNLKFIIGCFYGWINSHQEKAFVLENKLHTKEDYERTVKYYLADGGVVRFNYMAPKTKIYIEHGGIGAYRTAEHEKWSANYMLKTYPNLCRLNTTRKHKFSQILLRNKSKKK